MHGEEDQPSTVQRDFWGISMRHRATNRPRAWTILFGRAVGLSTLHGLRLSRFPSSLTGIAVSVLREGQETFITVLSSYLIPDHRIPFSATGFQVSKSRCTSRSRSSEGSWWLQAKGNSHDTVGFHDGLELDQSTTSATATHLQLVSNQGIKALSRDFDVSVFKNPL